ncbi:hypothetical protein MKX01_039407 [Papaver californicum]|nr:hypothetical protein MKX01_039407 [Papaver californicum]
MAVKLCKFLRTYRRKFKPHLLMVLAHVFYVTYRHNVFGLVVLPFAYFLEGVKFEIMHVFDLPIVVLLRLFSFHSCRNGGRSY